MFSIHTQGPRDRKRPLAGSSYFVPPLAHLNHLFKTILCCCRSGKSGRFSRPTSLTRTLFFLQFSAWLEQGKQRNEFSARIRMRSYTDRDTVIAIPCDCLSVTLRYCVTTAKRIVESLSLPASSIIRFSQNQTVLQWLQFTANGGLKYRRDIEM